MKSFQTLSFINIQVYPHEFSTEALLLIPFGLELKKGNYKVPFCDPLGARTQDPNIKSVVLYQLS